MKYLVKRYNYKETKNNLNFIKSVSVVIKYPLIQGGILEWKNFKA